MKRPENNSFDRARDKDWLDEALTRAIGSEESKPNFEKWKQDHPEAVEMLTSRASSKPSAYKHPLNIRNIIMKRRIIKLAAAAVIIIAVLIGLNQFESSATSVAWGQVAKNVEQAQTFICQSQSQINAAKEEPFEIDTVIYFSSKYGIRIDAYKDGEATTITYGIRAEKAIITVMHPMKKYVRNPLPESESRRMEQMGPKELVKRFLSTKYKELGRDTIEGIQVEGVETNDPGLVASTFPIDSLLARLWVDVETGLPVLLESEIVGNSGASHIKTVMDKFQWNVELDASDFEPNIPADYTLLEE